MADYVNEVHWSETRARLLRQCRYRYWIAHYLAWGGWLPTARPEVRRAYLLKKMFTIPMWTGIIVHEVIETAIQTFRETGRMPTITEMQDDALQRFDVGWKQSKDGAWEHNPKLLRLREHHYELGVTKGMIDAVKVKLCRCIDNFSNHQVSALIASREPDQFMSHEQLITFQLKGNESVAVKMDLVVACNDMVCILDWKTGKPNPSIADQLTVYAMYWMKTWKIKLEKIRAVPIYLDQLDVRSMDQLAAKHTVTMEMVMKQAEVIRTEFAILMEADYQRTNRSAFQPTANSKACFDCPFTEICKGAGSKV